MSRGRKAVSNTVFAVSVVLLLIIAGAGFGLYLGSPSSARTSTSTVTTTVMGTNSTAPGVTGGFLGSRVVTFLYTRPYICTPSTAQLYPDQAAAGAKAECETGMGGTFPSDALPQWVTVPAYAGLSVFGVTALGASSEGYPLYHNQTILTDCGGGGSPASCPDHPAYMYSPAFTAVEQHLGIANGYGGLPEGVLPLPAHNHIVDTDAGGRDIPWPAIAVLVFDPNILPNPVTGRCQQVVTSSLQNATGNCLTSIGALQRAIVTNNTAIADANAGNPIWQTLGQPDVQAIIPGDTSVSTMRNPNTNIDIYFPVIDTNPYPPSKGSQQSLGAAIGVIGVACLVAVPLWLRVEEASSGTSVRKVVHSRFAILL